MNCIYILLIILVVFIICSMFNMDHFKPINSLKIKYNAEKVERPEQYKKPTPKELSLKEKINSELSSHPLTFKNQMYSMDVYSGIGEKQLCNHDRNCSQLTSTCNFKREDGVGVCTLRTPDKTVFDIKY